MRVERKDSKGRVLYAGEYELKKQDKNGNVVVYYCYQYRDVAGKRSSVSATSLALLRERKKEIGSFRGHTHCVSGNPALTVSRMADIYLETKINLRETSAANYQYMLNRFIRPSRIGKMKLNEVKKSDIQMWYGELLQSGFKANSLEVIHTILHPTFQRAIDDGYITMNPTNGVMNDIKRSPYWEKTRKRALTRQEQEEFVRFVRANPTFLHWMPLFTVLLGTGGRIGEIIGLTWDDVDFAENCIYIRHNLVYKKIGSDMRYLVHSPKTEAGGREIPMLQEVRDTLENLYQMHKENHLEPLEIDGKSYDLVFRNRVHGILMPSSINQAIKRIVKSYNEVHPTNCLPYFSVHQMRHTFATRLCENCTNMKAIQEIMGHSSIRTTMDVYATSTKESRRHTLDELQGKCVIF